MKIVLKAEYDEFLKRFEDVKKEVLNDVRVFQVDCYSNEEPIAGYTIYKMLDNSELSEYWINA